MGIRNIASVLTVAFIVSAVIALAGFLNGRIVFASSSLGLFLGIAAFLVLLGRRSTGWEDLIGPLVFFQIVGMAFIIGLVLEVAVKIIRRPKEQKNK